MTPKSNTALRISTVLFVLIQAGLSLPAASPLPWRAGQASLSITPSGPVWMSGYGNRNRPSDGVMHQLWAKALAIEDSKGQRAVFVTTDLIGLSRPVAEQIAGEVLKRYNLDRQWLLLNSSHTHTGPAVRENLNIMFDLAPEDMDRIRAYTATLTETIIAAVGAALAKLEPATLSYGRGSVGFAVNRREFTAAGKVKIGVNPAGSVDHSVPVLAVRRADGSLMTALFGYACHNTTLTGEFYKVSGDYAGFAQIAFEKKHPGAAAMFMILAGADQNPHPRSSQELAVQHGEALATAVDAVFERPMKPVRGPLRAAFQVTELALAQRSRDEFEAEAKSSTGAAQRRAREMLKALDERRPIFRLPYPVQAIRLGKDVTYTALGGELVVGYGLRTKREFPREETVVVGYSNDVMCYIPTAKILAEGGYEAVDSMVYYGQPGPFAPDVEDRVMAGVRQVMKRVGRNR